MLQIYHAPPFHDSYFSTANVKAAVIKSTVVVAESIFFNGSSNEQNKKEQINKLPALPISYVLTN